MIVTHRHSLFPDNGCAPGGREPAQIPGSLAAERQFPRCSQPQLSFQTDPVVVFLTDEPTSLSKNKKTVTRYRLNPHS
jgi:hypothetical protein